MPKPLQQETSSVWKLRPYISPQLSIIARALVCTAIFTVFWPILAWLAGEMAQYIGEGDVGSLTQLAAVAAVFFLLRGLAQFGQDTFMARAALKIAFNLRTSVYAHLQTLSLDYFETAKTGDLSYRLTEDSDRIGEAINKFFHDFIPCVLQIIAVVGYMIYLNWQLTVSVIVIAPLMGLLIGGFGERLLQLSRRAQSKISNLAALLTEVFGGMRLIQAFTAEAYEIERFNHEARQNQDAQYRTAQLKALQFVVVGFLEAMSVVLLFCLAGWQIGRGNLTGAEFVSYGVAVAMLIDPIGHITENYNHFKQSEASCDRVFELLALKPDITEPQDALELKQVQ
ncbi:MAG: ABC transporter ATP-binding protein, partial [Cyanobacteria bacterium P01_H01_bin.15]